MDGGTGPAMLTKLQKKGLSPRGRGNLGLLAVYIVNVGSIPAWTGEPEPGCNRCPAAGVYPRVDGGTLAWAIPGVVIVGLSPRGRGNQHRCNHGAVSTGSIPAWTGEPVTGMVKRTLTMVYPRVDGGTAGGRPLTNQRHGLSPRGRGNLITVVAPKGPCGSIPAWTGEPVNGYRQGGMRWVYPRVDGGTSTGGRHWKYCAGLSPRGRGNLYHTPPAWRNPRSIPAWTGEPDCPLPGALRHTVYPRVDGGTSVKALCRMWKRGLSPRGRGNPTRRR